MNVCLAIKFQSILAWESPAIPRASSRNLWTLPRPPPTQTMETSSLTTATTATTATTKNFRVFGGSLGRDKETPRIAKIRQESRRTGRKWHKMTF